PLEDAITVIQDFIIDPSSMAVYAIDKRGILLKAENGRVIQLQDVYQEAGAREKIALYRGAVDDKGSVYVTDIASDRLLCFDRGDGYQHSKVLDGAALWNVAVNHETGLFSVVRDGQISVLDAAGEVVLEGSEFEKSSEILLREGLFYLLLSLAALGALYAFLRIVLVAVTFKYSEVGRTGVLVATCILVVTTIIVGQLMSDFRAVYRQEILNKMIMSAQIVSNTTDSEALKAIKTPRDYMNDDYKKLLNSITTTIDKNYAYSDDMYCNILKREGDKAFAVAYLDNSIGAYFPLFDAEAEEVHRIYDTGEVLLSDTISETGSYIYAKTPILDSNGQVIGVVEVGTLSDVLDSSVNQMIRDLAIPLTMIILVVLFIFSEFFSFFDLGSKYQEVLQKRGQGVPLHLIRVLVWVTFVAFNMATSFLPVYIMKFVGADIGISKELAASIPMSVNIAFIAVTSLFCARPLAKYGFFKTVIAAGCFGLIGDLCMALAQNYGVIVVGLALNGVGVGIVTNAIYMYLASVEHEEDEESGVGFSIFSAASLSGISCGMMFGAALAQSLGQGNVFFISSGVWLIIVVGLYLLKNKVIASPPREQPEESRSLTLWQFMVNKNILSFMILVQIPYIMMSAFIYYYVPIYAYEQGFGETESCMLIMISSLCSVYLSVVLTDYLSRKIKDNTIYLSSLITYIALILFAVKMTVPMLVIALLLIGIANSFGTPSRTSYFANTREANAYGMNRAMGIYNFVDNIGESAGPMVLAGVISVGFFTGMATLVAAFAGMNGLFALSRLGFNKNNKLTTGV
ncbi:MAG: MFS transporter, partial [Clostridia bacterium]|nr:MFS transporter [Clostridia bacterium]